MTSGKQTTGLLGLGRSERWSINIDESFDAKSEWFEIVITHTVMHLQFTVRDLSELSALLRFLRDTEVPSSWNLEGTLEGRLSISACDDRLWVCRLSRDAFGGEDMLEVAFDISERVSLAAALAAALEDAGIAVEAG
jgi:hypothetical protein